MNKTQFWAKPAPCTGWTLFNNKRGIFKDNPALRRAVSWGLDRTDYAAAAGPYAGSPWTHLLPPGFPGSIDARNQQPYSPRANVPKARRLAAGHFRGGTVVIAYWSGGATRNAAQAALVRRDLIGMGFKPGKVKLEPFYTELTGLPPANWDLLPADGWCAEYSDPYDFFTPFLAAPGVEPGYPLIVLDDTSYVRRIAAADKLVGRARLAVFGRLDLDMTENLAPVAAMRTYNNRYLFSSRVDPKSLVYEGVYSDWSLPALALKR